MAPSTRKRKSERPPNRTLKDFFAGVDETKRRKTTATRAEIIIIDDDDDDNNHEGNAPGLEGNLDTFGAPSNLLRSTSPETSRNDLCTRPQFPTTSKMDQSMFGPSAPLLESAVEDGTAVKSMPSAYGNVSISSIEDTSTSGLEGGLPVGEWSTADDETNTLSVSYDDGNEGGGESFLDQLFCPVCGMDLSRTAVFDAETHVNQCLDETSQTGGLTKRECTSLTVSTEDDVKFVDGPRRRGKHESADLFAELMSSSKEVEIWSETIDTDRNLRSRGDHKGAPFYKVLEGMPIAVDAFCYGTIPGVTAYFLTHAHSDHFTSLGSKWNSGPIYCSRETASLIIHMLTVNPKWIHPLSWDTPTVVPNTGGVTVTLIDANHCPGSCLFYFEGHQTVDIGNSKFKSSADASKKFRYLHCGDFRASPSHVLHPAVNGKHIDYVYLDTTYLDSKYIFPPQPLVISACVELARRLVIRETEGKPNAPPQQGFTLHAWIKPTGSGSEGQQTLQERLLVVVGTYSIGKERIVKAIAQALETKIYCDTRKAAILRCQADKDLHALLTSEPAAAGVHILPLGAVTLDNLRLYLQRFKGIFSRIIGFRPTGWTYSSSGSDPSNASIQSIVSRGQSRHFSHMDLRPSPKSSYDVQIFGVPYSEHSSFFELTCFAMSCDWGRIIPTVNMGSATSREKITRWLKRWELQKKTGKSFSILPRTEGYW